MGNKKINEMAGQLSLDRSNLIFHGIGTYVCISLKDDGICKRSQFSHLIITIEVKPFNHYENNPNQYTIFVSC